MKLQFLGAVRQVTGSQYYLRTNGARVLVDCGMFQEREFLERNWNAPPVAPRDIDAVLLTHAHVDHCGLVPRLVQAGFRGPILATAPSVDLMELVLRDSAQIQMEDVEFKRKRHRKEGRKGRYPEQPLYTLRDVEKTLPLLQPVRYGTPIRLNSHVTATFFDAGHILGSAMIQIEVQGPTLPPGEGRGEGASDDLATSPHPLPFSQRARGESPRRILFSGDMGQLGRPFVCDPTQFAQADYVVMESTYGDRVHTNGASIEDQLAAAIGETVAAGGKTVIPIFAIERAQELIYYLGRLMRGKRIPSVPVYLDSPMAADVTEVFRRHRECFDAEMWSEIESGQAPLSFSGLSIVRSSEQSKAINREKGPSVILATNGMCTAGRIKHHLAQYIDRPECAVLFVGYQASGTLGRQILDGSREVRIHGRSRLVRARVAQVAGFSGHADRDALLNWLRHFTSPPQQLFLTHGEENGTLALADEVRRQLGWKVTVPAYQQVAEL